MAKNGGSLVTEEGEDKAEIVELSEEEKSEII